MIRTVIQGFTGLKKNGRGEFLATVCARVNGIHPKVSKREMY